MRLFTKYSLKNRISALYRRIDHSKNLVTMKFTYVLFLTLALLITACGGSDSSMEMESDAEMHEDGAMMEDDAMMEDGAMEMEADSADAMEEADSTDMMMEGEMEEEAMEEESGEEAATEH